MKRKIVGVIVLVWFASVGLSQGSFQEYSKATKFAKAGQSHFAFMHFNKIVRNFPNSKYRDQALFATAEYYFSNSELKQASNAFQIFIDENPEAPERLYALAYLLNIAKSNQDEELVSDLERQIIELHQVSLVFRDKKEMTYKSPLHQKYKTVFQIDQIKFYAEGELFATVYY